MAETDYIIPEGELIISQTSTFSFKDFYSTMKDWFNNNGYKILEKKYEEILKGKTKDFKIKWDCEKKVDDYTKIVIGMKMNVSDSKIVDYKHDKLTKGKITIIFESKIVSDYEEQWENQPSKKFWRGLYDKFFVTDKRKKYQKELKEDTYDIYNRVKSFLNIQRF